MANREWSEREENAYRNGQSTDPRRSAGSPDEHARGDRDGWGRDEERRRGALTDRERQERWPIG